MVLNLTHRPAVDHNAATGVATSAAPPGLSQSPSAEGTGLSRGLLVAGYVVVAALLVAYVVSVIVRSPDQHWTWLDGWGVGGIEVVAALLCLAKSSDPRNGRACLLLGLSLLAWAVGDVLLTAESMGGSTEAPTLADGFYLCFYPLAYVAVVQLLRSTMGRRDLAPNWLDGAIAGLGAAAVCSAFLFHGLLHDLGDTTAAVATNLAYPIGDLLLLSLVVGGTVMLSGRWSLKWLLLASGILVNVVGDTFNLFQSSEYASRIGNDFDSCAWPIAIALISASVWVGTKRPDPLRRPREAGTALPGAAALACLVILVVASTRAVSGVAIVLAIVTLVAAAARYAISSREIRRVTEDRHHQAMTDPLTGLSNRRRLLAVLDETVGATADVALLYIDLDRFKELNDSFGHAVGDEILALLAPRICAAIPTSGLAARLGGDEFCVVLFDEDAAAAEQIATAVHESITSPLSIRGVPTAVGASIGLAHAPADAPDASGLLWCADVAMYRAKTASEHIATFDAVVDGREDQLDLARELRVALAEGQFELHFQPQLDLSTGSICGVEALIRWPHPRLGMIAPLRFVPLAEETGLIHEVTAWVLEHALAQAARWRAAGHVLTTSVNVAASDLLEPGFADAVMAASRAHLVAPADVVIEITETSVITEFARSTEVISQLSDLGFAVSIDDFGAGFTSLAYLAGLAVDELKLDRSFITGMHDEGTERSVEVVRSTIQLGHDVGLRVVAEGVEDMATLDRLRELGCDVVQGYVIGRPMPADELTEVLARHRADDLSHLSQ